LDPFGFDLRVSFLGGGPVRLGVAWSAYEGHSQGRNTFCETGFPTYLNCADEPASFNSRVRLLRIALSTLIADQSSWRWELGAGVGLATLRARRVSRTSGRVETAMPGGSIGVALHMGLSRPLAGPLRIGGTTQLFAGTRSGCATDVFAPFCTDTHWVQLTIGVSAELRQNREAH
jgi:hypothetical protein